MNPDFLSMERTSVVLEPMSTKPSLCHPREEREMPSRILAGMNERSGLPLDLERGDRSGRVKSSRG